MSRFSGFGSAPPNVPEIPQRSAFSGFGSAPATPPDAEAAAVEVERTTADIASGQRAQEAPGAADDLQPVDPNRGPGRPPEKSGVTYTPEELLSIKDEALAEGDEDKAARVDEVNKIRETEGIPGEDPQKAKERKLRESLKGSTFEFDGKQVPSENVFKAADHFGVSHETILRAGQGVGKFESRMAKTVLGQTLLYAEAGLSDLAATALSLTDRVAGDGQVSANLKRSQALRQEYLNFVGKGSDLETILGERGNRIYNGVVQSLAKVAATGQVGAAVGAPGTAAVLSGLAAENLDTGLNDADDLGLKGSDRRNFALRRAGIETAITYGMGRVGQRLGIASVEEMLSPGMRAAATNLFTKSGAANQLAKLAKAATGVGMEAGEEVLVDVVTQLNDANETGASINYERMADAGISGAVGGAGVNLAQGLSGLLGRKVNNTTLEETVKGVKAAEAAIMQPDGTDPEAEQNAAAIVNHKVAPETPAQFRGMKAGTAAVKQFDPETLVKLAQPLTSKEFAKLTGLKRTSKAFRESFASTVEVYHDLYKPQVAQPENAPGKPNTPKEGEAAAPPQTPGEAAPDDGVKTATETAQGSAADPQTVVDTADTTSAQRVDIDADREVLGLEAIPTAATQGWESDLNLAKQQKVPERALDLAADVIANPRAFSPVETAGMVVRAADIKKQYNARMEVVNQSSDATLSTEDVAAMTRLESEFDTVSEALRLSGTEKGRALNAQKLRIDDNFDLVSVMSRVNVANQTAGRGPNVTSEQRRKYADLVGKLDAAKKEMKAAKPGSDQHILADFKRRKAETRLRSELYREKLGTFGQIKQGGKEVFGAMRTMMATGDFSAIGRQGIFSMFSHPLRTLETVGPTLRAARSELGAQKALLELRNRPNGKLYERSGLVLHDNAADMTSREETLASDVFEYEGLDNVPWIKTIRKAAQFSNRHFATYVNQLRADTFDQLLNDLAPGGNATQAELKAIANFANVVTGRGGFGKFESSVDGLGQAFFAPRFVSARFQTALGVPIGTAPTARTAKAFAGEYRRMLSGFAGTVMMAMAAFGDDLDVSFTVDPRSTDAFKLVVGDTRIDLLGGLTQPLVYFMQLLSGERIDSKTGKVKEVDAFDLTARFGKKKLSPLFSGGFELLSGKNAIGQETTPIETISNRFTPIAQQELIRDAFTGQLDAETMQSLTELVGLGIRTYEAR